MNWYSFSTKIASLQATELIIHSTNAIYTQKGISYEIALFEISYLFI